MLRWQRAPFGEDAGCQRFELIGSKEAKEKRNHTWFERQAPASRWDYASALWNGQGKLRLVSTQRQPLLLVLFHASVVCDKVAVDG